MAELVPTGQPARTPRGPTPLLIVSILIVTLLLTVFAAGEGVLPGDVAIAREVQALDFPGAGTLEDIGYILGGLSAISGIGLLLMAAFLIMRRIEEGFLMLAVVLVRNLNRPIKWMIQSPRPTEDLVRVTEDASFFGFPSGHVMGTVLLYGCIIYLAHLFVKQLWLRIPIQVLSIAAILITSFARVYSGAHWPSDVLGGYLWGTFVLLVLLSSYHVARIRRQRDVRAGERPPVRHLMRDEG